ncbi:MAG: xanthine dehydrogenase family protein subunit M [Dehalococcoidia bacterium]|nr:xanthine dehydrogenase family protein subunit M [Dehalococcoidia bacterium]
MIPAAFEYEAPATLMEALALLRRHRGAKLLAGGHSLLPMMKLRLAAPERLIDISRIKELAGIRESRGGGTIVIGALTPHGTLESSALLQEKCPLLAEAAAVIGDPQVRNRGTIGGSLAHADPAADLPAALLALDATLTAMGTSGARRQVPARRFFRGLLTTALRPTEVLTEITVPVLKRGTGSAYEKFANKASRFAVVGVAAVVALDRRGRCSQVAIGITGAGPKAVRAVRAEAALLGREPTAANIAAAAARASAAVGDALSDIHASSEFRLHLTEVLTRRALARAAARA